VKLKENETIVTEVVHMPGCMCGKCIPGRRTPCEYCHTLISMTRRFCPHCGHPQGAIIKPEEP
jgi:hypothetical protein